MTVKQYESKGKILWLHVGYPKTATTTLQEHFFPRLAKEDMYYIGKRKEVSLLSPAARIFCDAISRSDLECATKHLELILQENAAYNHFCFSAEETINYWQHHHPRMIATSAKMLKSITGSLFENIKILLVIRKQADYLCSAYAEFFGDGSLGISFSDYIDNILNNSSYIHGKSIDYYDCYKVFAEQFGADNVFVAPFECLQQTPLKYYHYILDSMALERTKYLKVAIGKEENVRKNCQGKKVDRVTFYHKLALLKSKIIPYSLGIGHWKVWKLLSFPVMTEKKARQLGESIVLSEQEQQDIYQRYVSSNQKLSDELGLNLKSYGYCDN